MRNTLLSSKLKQTKVHLLIIDDTQIRYNQIVDLLTNKGYQVDAFLLDDLSSFEKQIQIDWDIVLFGQAYDLKVEQALALIHASPQPQLPLLLLNPEGYHPSQYMTYINKGIYDLFNLDYPDRFYIGLLRTLSYSRALKTHKYLLKELDIVDAQIKIQTKENNKAIALIQEGIHIQANHEYLTLFGLQEEDDIIGMPLLDILQPENTADFKQRFKRISQNNFDQANFSIFSQNSNFSEKEELQLEFFPDLEEEAVQLSIENSQKEVTVKSNFDTINRKMINDPANYNAMIVFKLDLLDETIYQFNQEDTTLYLESVYNFIKEQMHNIVVKLTPSTYVSLCQGATEQLLNSKIMGLEPLTKPQLLEVQEQNYPLQFRIGYCQLEDKIESQEQFDFLFSHALSTSIKSENSSNIEFEQPTTAPTNTIDFALEEQPISNNTIEPVVEESIEIETNELEHFEKALKNGEIHLKYQQLYDKQDINLYTYEVTSGIIHENKWIDLCDSEDLLQDSELAIKIDRWILVEACKQLNNFIVQYPTAKLIVNLNSPIIEDNQFVTLITKLLSIMSNAHKNALILQFNTHDTNNERMQNIAENLQSQHVAISLRNFGTQPQLDASIAQKIKPELCYLDLNLTKMINTEKSLNELQEQLQQYVDVDIILPKLDDMTTFANSWNVDARYLQGAYFQKKLDHLTDVQDN